MLKQMCDFRPVDKEISNWETFNDLYFEKYRKNKELKWNSDGSHKLVPYNDKEKPLGVYISYIIRYCDNCDTIMYWPYTRANVKSMVHVMAEPEYNDPIAKELTKGENRLKKYADKAEENANNTTICPVCGEPLSKEKGFYYSGGYFDLYKNKGFNQSDLQKDVEKDYEFWMGREREKAYKAADEITAKNEYEKSIKGISDTVLTDDIQPTFP